MQFFVPGFEDDPDKGWETFRQVAGAGPSERRIYSITFDHKGDRCVATVGQPVSIRKNIPKRSRRWREYGENLEAPRFDSATVLAIFEGDPIHRVVTDARPISDRPSGWANPFLVGSSGISASEDFE